MSIYRESQPEPFDTGHNFSHYFHDSLLQILRVTRLSMITVTEQFCTRERPIDQESVMTSGKWLPCATTIRIWFNWSYYGPILGQLDSKRMLSDMQRIVDIARQNGVYVIITIFNNHFSRNGQLISNWLQANITSSKTDPDNATFWLNDGDFLAKQRNAFLNLWNTISSKFRNEPIVGTYDLINEPFNKYYQQPPQ